MVQICEYIFIKKVCIFFIRKEKEGTGDLYGRFGKGCDKGYQQTQRFQEIGYIERKQLFLHLSESTRRDVTATAMQQHKKQ